MAHLSLPRPRLHRGSIHRAIETFFFPVELIKKKKKMRLYIYSLTDEGGGTRHGNRITAFRFGFVGYNGIPGIPSVIRRTPLGYVALFFFRPSHIGINCLFEVKGERHRQLQQQQQHQLNHG
jgi:hypothetical protein